MLGARINVNSWHGSASAAQRKSGAVTLSSHETFFGAQKKGRPTKEGEQSASVTALVGGIVGFYGYYRVYGMRNCMEKAIKIETGGCRIHHACVLTIFKVPHEI